MSEPSSPVQEWPCMADLASSTASQSSAPALSSERPLLAARIPPGGTSDPDEILSLFLE